MPTFTPLVPETEGGGMYVSKFVSQGSQLQAQETSALKGSHQYSSPRLVLRHPSQLGLQSFGPRVCQAETGFFPLPMSQRARLDLQRRTLTHKPSF